MEPRAKLEDQLRYVVMCSQELDRAIAEEQTRRDALGAVVDELHPMVNPGLYVVDVEGVIYAIDYAKDLNNNRSVHVRETTFVAIADRLIGNR